MICQECKKRPATLHFTKVINGEKNEIHLCEKCANENSELFILNSSSGFSIHNLLAGLLNADIGFSEAKKSTFPREAMLRCDHCSMTYQQFVKLSRFGCSHCYESFREQLIPILRRLHSGNSLHHGKIPQRTGGNIHTRKKLEDRKKELKDLVTKEEFEKAASVRDEIRALEKKLAESNEGSI
ncbi:UvrB/UvrC motif-containing protein [Bacillaceae bacterium Marseille-Q3522]|nr:UvrB/UvrC motif-containing protein [Bacillaceae bacterium Marseille-Q3522]